MKLNSILNFLFWVCCFQLAGAERLSKSEITPGKDKIRIAYEGSTREAEIRASGGSAGNEWLEVDFPSGGKRQRVRVSEAYAWVKDSLVGIDCTSVQLLLAKSTPVDLGEVAQAPEDFCLRWSRVFGSDLIHLEKANFTPITISRISSDKEGLRIHILIDRKVRGSILLNPDLGVISVEVDTHQSPILYRPIPASRL